MTGPLPPLRILHAPRNIANQAGYAAAALRRLGHHVEVWEYGENPFAFPVDRVIDTSGRDPRLPWAAFLDFLDRFDVFHFHFGRSLLSQQWSGLPPFWDLPVLRMLGKRVFVTFHGSDVRIRRIHEQVNPWSHYRLGDVPADDDRTEKVIEVFRTYADRMFAVSVNYLHFVPEAEVLPRIIDLAAWPALPVAQRARPVILHAPSRRGPKGTELILAAFGHLAEEGLPFDLHLLEGVTHAEARAAIAGADIIVDTLLSGSYGVTSMEAMASGRVAVANLSDEVRQEHPDCPVVDVDPTTFEDRLRTLIADTEGRRRLAAAGRDFVARVHDAPVIAARLDECYRAPGRAVPRRAMPDWLSLDSYRRIELLDSRLARLQQDLARATRREAQLRRQLGLAQVPASARLRARVRPFVPRSIREWVRSRRASRRGPLEP